MNAVPLTSSVPHTGKGEREQNMSEAMQEHLKQVELAKLGPDIGDILKISQDETVEGALRRLAQKGVVAAPVVGEDGHFQGFVGVRGIVEAFLNILGDQAKEGTPMLRRMRELEGKGEEFGSMTLEQAWEPLSTYRADSMTTVADAVRDGFLATKNHRVAVLSAEGGSRDIVTIVTQSDIAKYAREHSQLLGDLASNTLEELGLASRGTTKVTPQTPTLDVLRHLSDTGKRGVAVCEQPNGELIANLSITDFVQLEVSHFGALALPCAEFLAFLHGTTYSDFSPATSTYQNHPVLSEPKRSFAGQELATCSPKDTLGSCLETLVEKGIHRLYVVDDSFRPLDAFTLDDILRLVDGRLSLPASNDTTE